MKLRYIISSIFTLLAVALSCTKVDDSHLSQVQVSKSYVAFPVEGGSVDVIVNATADWAINDIPEWLTVSPAAGHAGESGCVRAGGEFCYHAASNVGSARRLLGYPLGDAGGNQDEDG